MRPAPLVDGVREYVLFRQTVEVWVGDVMSPCSVLCRRFENSTLDAAYVDMWRCAADDDFADHKSYVILGHDAADDAAVIRSVIEGFDGYIAAVAHPAPPELP